MRGIGMRNRVSGIGRFGGTRVTGLAAATVRAVAMGVLVAAGLTVLAARAAAPAAVPQTPAEAAGFKQYSQNEAIGKFLSEADALSKELSVRIVGRSQEVKDYPAHDIFLAILSAEGAGGPEGLDRKKPTLLITAAQHGNEQSAKEAALALIRDLAVGEMKPLLAKMNVLIMPQTNPYGNRFDVRRNEIGLDMNRDHVKLEAAGVAAIHRVFREWMPEFTIDVHEKGDDYYRVNVGCVSNAVISRVLQDYSRRTLLREVEARLARKNLTFHEYLVTEEMGDTGAAGVTAPAARTAAAAAPAAKPEEYTRYSTTDINDGRNSLGIYETLSFIQEGASRHDLETLEARTRWQYWGLRSLMEAAADRGDEIVRMVRDLRSRLLEKGKAYAEDDQVCMRSAYARDPKAPTLTLKRFDRSVPEIEGVLKVDKKAGETYTAEDVGSYPYPANVRIVTEIIKNWFPGVSVKTSVARPLGYLIPAARFDLVETLLRQGVAVDMFIQDKSLDVEASEVREIVPATDDYLAPAKIVVERKAATTVARSGDFYVSCGQPGANLIPCLLEAESEYGMIRYWKFGMVPKAGDMFAIFRVVKPQVLRLVPYKPFGVGL